MAADPITAVATLLTKVFGFAVDPSGFAQMKLEHQLEVIHAGIKVANDNGNTDAVDALFEQFRELYRQTSG